MQRPLCSVCNANAAAVNYSKNGVRYYRKLCNSCTRKGKKYKPVPPIWFKSGYRKQACCDRCGWRAKYPDKQMAVYYVDGNLRNNSTLNLKTVCLNCRVEIAASRLAWREAEIKADF